MFGPEAAGHSTHGRALRREEAAVPTEGGPGAAEAGGPGLRGAGLLLRSMAWGMQSLLKPTGPLEGPGRWYPCPGAPSPRVSNIPPCKYLGPSLRKMGFSPHPPTPTPMNTLQGPLVGDSCQV